MSRQNLPFDIDAIRSDFPILSLEVNGKPLTYLDNAASAQKPRQVIDATKAMMEEAYANVHRGLHYLSNEATERFERARLTAQSFLGAARHEEVIFTKNASEGINLVAQSYLAPMIEEGDEIIISLLEHHSNIVPWHFLRERQGAVIKWLPVSEDGQIRIEDLQAAISPRTKMIALTQMSNALGTLTPVEEICKIAREHGIATLIDGSQGAVHLDVDVKALDCDFYVATGHKLYGPSGIGLLYGRYELLKSMQPFLGGGEMIGTVEQERVTYAEPPHRFEAGTPAIIEAEALHHALGYINQVGKENIRGYEAMLTAYARERLAAIPKITVVGDHPDKAAIFSFVHETAHAHDISMIIDQEGVAVRAGTHCTMPLLQHLGLTATCRASFAFYNTMEEVDRLAAALEKVNRFF